MLKAWSKAIASPAQEFPLTPLSVLSGQIPQGLQGTLYRNGPARLERGGVRVGHWFDGDGAILAVHFTEANATATYRYVQTIGYQKESAADAFLFPNYGMNVSGPIWNNWGKEVKNSANTSVLALSNKLLALWEGGKPHALDLQTLETLGTDDLCGLNKNKSFSAHPKVDPQTGEIFNFGTSLGKNIILNLYRCDRTGKIVKKGSLKLEGFPLIHDFVMAGEYLVFFVPPVRIDLLSVALGKSNYSDAMKWKPELGTEILVFDRHNFSLVSRGKTDPWYQWHFTNGYLDQDGSLVAEIVRFEDFQTNQNLKEIASGKIETQAMAALWQIRFNPKTSKLETTEKLLNRGCEFPSIARHEVGQSWRYTYLSVYRDGADIPQEILGAIARFDRQTGNLSVADMGENRYPSEPIYVQDIYNPQQGWILTVVYDGNTNTSEVRIYDSECLEEEPVCRLGLPSVIPHGFHGTFATANL
jgi:all-trans-8'-apo-beta-carotenal 15,15'-oxygenase